MPVISVTIITVTVSENAEIPENLARVYPLLSAMARIARVVVPGRWHHITQQGNGRQTVFFDDTDRAIYLSLLARHAGKNGVRIAGYCLMNTHVHLLAIPESEKGLARSFGWTHNDYARWFNMRRGRSGHLWQNRFYSCPLDEHHQWEALRYVEMNPVRAEMVAEASDWPWSSAAFHTGAADPTGIVDSADWRARWSPQTWREVLSQGVENGALWERIREATGTGRPAANDDFIRRLEAESNRRLRPRKRGPKAKAAPAGARLDLTFS
ncbi:MAG TPA: transposase [Candidatus Acidoferrales bacterium]|nr:transposase [Candidatus Acidoferrales bacterium]